MVKKMRDAEFVRHTFFPKWDRERQWQIIEVDDLDVAVPLGTVVHDVDTGEKICDLTKAGQRQMVAEGGRGPGQAGEPPGCRNRGRFGCG